MLLDVYMPVCDGFEFLERVGKDALLSTVPVVVTTGSNKPEDEAKCLQLGAVDFVTKPYNPEVVIGRVQSVIKLKESVKTLSVVEYDSLTGLYTMQAFVHHVQEILSSNSELSYDLTVLDLQEFKMVNSTHGENIGDRVLCFISDSLKRMMPKAILARNGDKFFALYASVLRFNEEEGRNLERTLVEESPIPFLKMKFGIYENVDKTQSVSILCDRVSIAANSIKNDYSKYLAIYDDKLETALRENRKMEADFDAALENEEFVIWYQPKINVRTEKIAGAEALVRWRQSDGTLVPPYKFIPLFERDGLISRLDEHVFRKVLMYQKERISSGKRVVPISINLSRNSIFRMGMIERYTRLTDEIGVPRSLVPLELTESATTAGKEIQMLVSGLSSAGYGLHMDDFGTGYSSLSSLTTMPFDTIKLDKSLSDQIGTDKGNTIIRHMIAIAQEMGMKVVAEGVENREQVDFLRDVGCDMIQGFYFSKPQEENTFSEMLNSEELIQSIDLNALYAELDLSKVAEFEIDDRSIVVLQRIAEDMMEGFFIYRAAPDETILYANQNIIKLFGCEDAKDFRNYTGNSFRGMVHPEEYDRVEKGIFTQLNSSMERKDTVDYRIIRKDGISIKVHDRGHCVHTDMYGNVFYVFVSADNAARDRR